MIYLDQRLRELRDSGRKLLVTYVTAGIREDWLEILQALIDGGSDAVEVQIPFSDPAMDGPTVQAACTRALARGTTPAAVFEELKSRSFDAPLAAMTYYNVVYRHGEQRFVEDCTAAGITAAVLPDLPIEHSSEWRTAAEAAGLATVSLVSPNTSDDRLRKLCDLASGFVYVVSALGVTGERSELPPSAPVLAARVKAQTDKPALIGFGVSTPEQAAQAASVADGVIVASALMRQVLDGAKVEEIRESVAAFRSSLEI